MLRSTGSRAELADRLRARLDELEESMIARMHAVADPTDVEAAGYVEGLRTAVTVALQYGIDGVERGDDPALGVPPALRAQARMAARSAVPLETVMRRYVAGYTLLTDLLIEEAERAGLSESAYLKPILRTQTGLFDRLMATACEEYAAEAQEAEQRVDREARRADLVERLLSGELVDFSMVPYEFGGAWHVAAIAVGRQSEAILTQVSRKLDCRLLTVERIDGSVWAWFGASSAAPDVSLLERRLAAAGAGDARIALGEPAEGFSGWRLSHRQAAAALPVAQRGPACVVRYSDVAVLAAALADDLLLSSLRKLFLAPLEQERDGGEDTRQTLRAYLGADRNVSSAAAALGVTRNTVASRLRAVEERLDRPIQLVAGCLELALRLDELES